MGRATLHWEQRLVLTAHGLNPQSSKSYVQNQNTHTQPSYTTTRPEHGLAQPLPDPPSSFQGVFLAEIQLPSLDQHLELQNPRRMLHKEQRNIQLGHKPGVFLQGVPAPACPQQPPHHPQPGQTCPPFTFNGVQLQF